MAFLSCLQTNWIPRPHSRRKQVSSFVHWSSSSSEGENSWHCSISRKGIHHVAFPRMKPVLSVLFSSFATVSKLYTLFAVYPKVLLPKKIQCPRRLATLRHLQCKNLSSRTAALVSRAPTLKESIVTEPPLVLGLDMYYSAPSSSLSSVLYRHFVS